MEQDFQIDICYYVELFRISYFCLYQFIEAFEEASTLLGNIDIVINNAGVLDERRWEKEISVNIVSIDNNLLIY